MNLNIHSIESFGTVDGPGVRFVIFVQGCPMRCLYCHNPDTWLAKDGTLQDIDELLRNIDDYRIFIKSGGVTVSGGEPLLYAKELTYLFKKLQEMNIHTCIDTSGHVPINDDIKTLLNYTNLVLLDIKAINDQTHKLITSKSNKNTILFASYLDSIHMPMWVRHVLLPEYNDSEKDLQELRKYLDTLHNIEKIELLPYHELGIFKWKELGLEYKLKHISPPTKESIEKAKKILKIKA